MPTTKQINDYLDRLEEEFSGLPYTIVPGGSSEEQMFPWVRKYVWVSGEYIVLDDGRWADPLESPSNGDRLFIATRNMGFGDFSVEFRAESRKRKILFEKCDTNDIFGNYLEAYGGRKGSAVPAIPDEDSTKIFIANREEYSDTVTVNFTVSTLETEVNSAEEKNRERIILRFDGQR